MSEPVESLEPALASISLKDPKYPLKVDYCPVCTMPFEYCPFSCTLIECKTHLESSNPELFSLIYSEIANGDPISVKQKTVKKTVVNTKVVVTRTSRNKRKAVITVSGLDAYGVDLKKAAKLFAGKFATGSSVVKNPQGTEDIVVQGDVQEEIYDMIVATWLEVPEDNIETAVGK